MSRWILGSEATRGGDPGLKKRNDVGCGTSCEMGGDTGEMRGDDIELDTGDITGFETNCESSGC